MYGNTPTPAATFVRHCSGVPPPSSNLAGRKTQVHREERERIERAGKDNGRKLVRKSVDLDPRVHLESALLT
jgi:hypothetical protein